MQFRRFLPLLTLALIATALVACDNDPDRAGEDLGPITPPDPIPLTRYVSSVALEGSNAAYSIEEMPAGEGAAPEVSGSQWFVRGGQMVMNVTVDDSATELYVSATNADIGFFTVPLSGSPIVIENDRARAVARADKLVRAGAEAAASQITAFRAPRTVTITLSPAETASNFTVVVRSSDGETISAASTNMVRVNTTANSSAELQASLNWIDPIDYDLHLVTPDGGRIFFAARTGQNGGQLDLDSNPACSIDNINNENITWASTSPAPGLYSLELDLWSACSQDGPFPYLVTLVIDGDAQTFEGSLPATAAGNVQETVITTFTIAD